MEQLLVDCSDVRVRKRRQSPKVSDYLNNFLFKGCCFQAPYETEVLFLVVVPKVAFGLIVLKRIEDAKFHLAEVVNLENTPLKRSDNPRPAKGNEYFFHWIQVNYPIGEARHCLHEGVVRKATHRDPALARS
jgi:hypothetical protein